jgi:hypothetical protein
MMHWKNIPRELVRVRKPTSKVGPIVCIILLCVVQLAWPTLLGWIALAVPVTILYMVGAGYLFGEWLRYGLDPTEAGALALYLVPVLALWWSNPVRRLPKMAG